MPRELRRAIRLMEVAEALSKTGYVLPDGALSAEEWEVIGEKAAKVIADQAWLESDSNGNPLVLAEPKLADPENPLCGPAKQLAASGAPGIADGDLRTYMTEYRDARSKLQNTLASDQEALKRVVTVRQESILVRMGILP